MTERNFVEYQALVAAGFLASLATTKVIFPREKKKGEVVELGLVNDIKVEAEPGVEATSGI